MTDGRQYWLTIAGETDCKLLSQMGFPFYALSRTRDSVARIQAGDRCVLYRARSNQGFIGVFEVTESAKYMPTKVGFRTYAARIPWTPIVLCESAPAWLGPLAPYLDFITNKKRYWAYFQTNLKQLSEREFSTLEQAVRKQSKSLGAAE